MLGYFLKDLQADRLSRVENPAQLEPGTAVVSVSNPEQLKTTGLPCELRFGIVASCYGVMCQTCIQEDIEAPVFRINQLSFAEFAKEGAVIYILACDSGRDPSRVLVDAMARYMSTIRSLRSYPGDDFVAECMTGLTSRELLERDCAAGQHWVTPLEMTGYECLKWLGVPVEKFAGIEYLHKPLLNQTHHGIAIEGGQVIHFSTRRVPDGKNCIKSDTQKEFCNITANRNEGGPVKYASESSANLYSSRNRAVWVFCHAENWGVYNLATNNCEHFSRYCRAGRKESRQVIAAVVEALGELISILPCKGRAALLIPLIGTPLKALSKMIGTPTRAHVPDSSFVDEESLIDITFT